MHLDEIKYSIHRQINCFHVLPIMGMLVMYSTWYAHLRNAGAKPYVTVVDCRWCLPH